MLATLPRGLKAHSHEDRGRIIETLVPLIVRHMGRDLIALAVAGSFARKSDGPYSDLDFVGFVRRRQNPEREVVNIIHDGLLIHIWFLTRSDYLRIHKRKVNAEWAYASAITLAPLINAPFIRDLLDSPSDNKPTEYRAAILELWPSVQEAVGKVLNAVIRREEDTARFLYWSMVEKLNVILSLLNAQPFSTRSRSFGEARKFALLPENYSKLFQPLADNSDLEEFGRRAHSAFGGVEQLLQAQGIQLYPGGARFLRQAADRRHVLTTSPMVQHVLQ